jgi:hypothetical protein
VRLGEARGGWLKPKKTKIEPPGLDFCERLAQGIAMRQ